MYYIGECNGPVGTGRFWYRMWQVTNDVTWLRWTDASAHTIMVHAGASAPFHWVYHKSHTDPVWNNYGLCDGTAGAVEYFNYLYQGTKNVTYWNYAGNLLRHCPSSSSSSSSSHLSTFMRLLHSIS
jgi:hypothetical protein